MIDTLYIERTVADHPRTRRIRERFPGATVIECERYGEVFNRRAQNFRLQKQRPALILAAKFASHVLPAPAGSGIGGRYNYYFSHMLNCLYDCRYCFLQGMFRSAHYVLFVNYEDFAGAIARTLRRHTGETVYFFSGYDCDSLALDPVTGFSAWSLDQFGSLPRAVLELRTKSTQIRGLLERPVVDNCVVAFSLAPSRLARAFEHRAPATLRRLDAMCRLQARGWQVGLRFDPVLHVDGAGQLYQDLIDQVFSRLDPARVHSVSLGDFRLPRPFHRQMAGLYPNDMLFAAPLIQEDSMIRYKASIREPLLEACRERILRYIPAERLFLSGAGTTAGPAPIMESTLN